MRPASSPPTSTSKKHLPVTLACSSTAPCRGTPISARQHASSRLGERGRAPVTGTYLRGGGADDDGGAAAGAEAEAEPRRGESAGGAEGERATPRRRRGGETGAGRSRRSASAEGADTAGVHAMVGFGLAYRIGDLEKAGAAGRDEENKGGLGLPRPPGLTVCFALGLEGKLGGKDGQSRGSSPIDAGPTCGPSPTRMS
jgi:hypothetical protein